jgi:hypothetical protein
MTTDPNDITRVLLHVVSGKQMPQTKSPPNYSRGIRPQTRETWAATGVAVP